MPRKHAWLAAMFFLTLMASALDASWWNSDWTYRRKISLDLSSVNDASGSATVLVRLSDGNFHFASAASDGSDLRFIAGDDKTPLAYHIEKFDTLLNEALVWVNIPDPKSSPVFWLYYGNATGKAQKVEDGKASYDDNTVLAYHFNERNLPAQDFTMNGNTGGAAGLAVEGSLIGPGVRFDGRTFIPVPAGALIPSGRGAPMTLSFWVKLADPTARQVIFSRKNEGGTLQLGVDAGVPFASVNGRSTQGGAPVLASGWHHVALASSGTQISLYVDGQYYSGSNESLSLSGEGLIGGDLQRSTAFSGEMDEFQISKVERSAGYLRLQAGIQGPDAVGKWITFGDEEQTSSWLSALKGGYVGVIVGSLTVDGWVVICILAVMSSISWFVMVSKAKYLNRIAKGNQEFLESWSHVATDLSVLDHEDGEHVKSLGGRSDKRAMRDSSLYRIYHIGVEEIRHRLSANGQVDGMKVLSSRSIQAIRASLDGGLVREGLKLNSGMVLLTIAISGGPFLGLLGTVVGVMITFAAVASAGEVNVNAIAPGIAAALLATVAGLGVAIPALFGYNYLLTRIKAVSTDTHVFIDEFISKLAEFYSDEVLVAPQDGADEQGKH